MSQERTEPPSPRKLRKLRERGDVWRSNDFSAAVGMLAAVIAFCTLGSTVYSGLRQLFTTACARIEIGQASPETVLTTCGEILVDSLPTLLMLSLPICIASTLAAAAQVRFVFALQVMLPKLSPLNPAAGMKRIFADASAYVELGKTLVKFLIAGAIAFVTLRERWPELNRLSERNLVAAAAWTFHAATDLMLRLCLLYAALGIADLLYQRARYMRRNRMSKEELRREIEEDEGKPEHRAERKQRHRELAEMAMIESTVEADVVLVNPTHIACALRFDPEKENAPRLIARGCGAVAMRIKEIARMKGIPIYPNIPLARALVRLEINRTIPASLYEAVKRVLLWVEDYAAQRGRTPAWLAHAKNDVENATSQSPAR